MEEVIPFKDTTIENNYHSREAFHSLIHNFYSLYSDVFYGCVVQETIQDPFQTCSTWPNINKVQYVHNVHVEGEDSTPCHESYIFLPYHSFACEEKGVVTNMFQNESSIDFSTIMFNREFSCTSS
jgi:hypothetical protein